MNWLRSLLLPVQGSSHAGEYDTLFLFITLLSAFFFLLIATLTGWSSGAIAARANSRRRRW